MTGRRTATTAAHRRPGRYAGNKFLVPASSRTPLARPALLRRLLDAPSGAVRVVVGSPGSGKSSLLADLAAELEPARTVWINTDPADVDPVRFWQGFIVGVRARAPGFGAEAFDLLTLDGRVAPDALESLLVDIERLERPITVIVDDLHLAAGDSTDHLRWLIGRGTPGLTLVIGSRHELDLGLDRRRVAGTLVEIGEADLRFDVAETAALVRSLSEGLLLSDADVALLQRRTEGWVAGILLALAALRDQADPREFLLGLAGTNQVIAPYLSAEVVGAQPEEVRAFLRDTCVVDELDAELAAALAVGSPVRLADIERRHLLLQRLDPQGTTYRYHHLFAELLRGELLADDPERASTLHRRAACWYERRGDLSSCFRHLWRAGDRSEALGLIGTSALDEYLSGRRHTVHAIVGTLSPADLAIDPDATVSLVAALVLEGRIEDASRLADRLEQVAGSLLSPAARLRLLSGRCFESLGLGDVERCLEAGAAMRALSDATGARGDWLEAGVSIELRARAWAGELQGVDELAARLRTDGPNLLEAVDHQSTVAQLRLVGGHLDDAEARCRSALRELESQLQHSPDLAVLPRAVLGTVLLERGDLAAARAQFETVVEVASATRRPATVLALLGLSRILRYEGAFDASLASLDDCRELTRHAPRSSAMVVAIEASAARTMLAGGDADGARLVLDDLAPGFASEVLAAHVLVAEGDLAAARAALADAPAPGRWAEALDLELARLHLEVRAGGTAVHVLAGDVLDLATPVRAAFPLAEAGRDVLAAVVAVARKRPQTRFLEAIQRTRPPAALAGLDRREFEADALSERERTVLRYLATALSYREIADDLYVSVNTVKTHVRNILRKLDADSRAEAVLRAQQLRYL